MMLFTNQNTIFCFNFNKETEACKCFRPINEQNEKMSVTAVVSVLFKQDGLPGNMVVAACV